MVHFWSGARVVLVGSDFFHNTLPLPSGAAQETQGETQWNGRGVIVAGAFWLVEDDINNVQLVGFTFNNNTPDDALILLDDIRVLETTTEQFFSDDPELPVCTWAGPVDGTALECDISSAQPLEDAPDDSFLNPSDPWSVQVQQVRSVLCSPDCIEHSTGSGLFDLTSKQEPQQILKTSSIGRRSVNKGV